MSDDDGERVKVPLRQFGPMHGEATRRHQFVSDGVYGGTIVSLYEVRWPEDDGPRFNVELMRQGGGGLLSADLTVEETAWLRDACDEYLKAYDDEPHQEGEVTDA